MARRVRIEQGDLRGGSPRGQAGQAVVWTGVRRDQTPVLFYSWSWKRLLMD